MWTASGQVQLDDLLAVCQTGDGVNEVMVCELLELFIEDNGHRIALAVDAAGKNDHIELRSAAHAVKGSAALIGAEQLSALAGDLELRAMHGANHDLSLRADQLQQEFRAVVQTLRARYPQLKG